MNEKRLPKNPDTDQFMFENKFPVASATECTGLVPAAPIEHDNVESYTDIYDVALTSNEALYRRHNRPSVFIDQPADTEKKQSLPIKDRID